MPVGASELVSYAKSCYWNNYGFISSHIRENYVIIVITLYRRVYLFICTILLNALVIKIRF